MSRQTLKTYPKSVWTKAKTPKWAKKPNKTNFSLIGWQNNEIRLQTLNSTRNWQKKAEITKFSDIGAICVRKRIFLEFSKFPLFGPRFPLFSRCFPAVRAQFLLFSRCFLAVFRAFWCFQGFAVKTHQKKHTFQEFCPKQWFCGQNTQKTKFSRILSKTVVLWPKRTKQTEFSDFYPNQVKTEKKNQFFRNLAQNRSKRTKRQNFQKSCFEKVKTHQKNTFFRVCVQNSAFAVKTHKQNQIFRNLGQNSGLRSKRAKQTKFSELRPQTAQNKGSCFRIEISMVFWAKSQFLHVF